MTETNSKKSSRLLQPFLFLIVILVAVFAFGWHFLDDRLPLRDFGGAAAWLWKVTGWFDGSAPFSPWVNEFFCGQPWTMIFPTLLWFIMCVPFALLWGPVLGLKIGILFYLALAGFTMFLFVRCYLRSVPAAWIAGFAYALHPIHIDLAARWGLTNFPVFYPYVPLLALLLVKLARAPSARLAAGTALVAALAFWADFQRPFVTYPFLAVLFLVEVLRRAKRDQEARYRPARALAWAAVSGALVLALLSFVLAGALVEQRYVTLVPEDHVASQQEWSSLNNPLYPLDRDGRITRELAAVLPRSMTYNAGTYYFGFVALAVGVIALAVGPKGPPREAVMLFAVLALGAYWVAFGVHSPYETWALFLGPIVNDPLIAFLVPGFIWIVFLAVIALLIGGGLFVARRRGKLSERWIVLGCVIAAVFIFCRPFVWLTRYVPFYANMRSPTWFAAVVPSFAGSVVLGAGLVSIAGRIGNARRVAAVFLVGAVLLAIDVWPYRARFDLDAMHAGESAPRPPANPTPALRNVGDWLATKGKPGRWIAADPYSPLADALSVYSGRSSAWAWLNWSSAGGLGRFFEGDDGVFARLMKTDRVREALGLLGIANVRYIVASPTYMVNRAVLACPELKKAYADGDWTVLENPAWRPYVQLYEWNENDSRSAIIRDRLPSEDADVANLEVGGGKISFDLDAPGRSLLVVSESWYPYWKASVDGVPAEPRAAEGAFLCVELAPGAHRVEFEYATPMHTKAGVVVSLVALAVAALMLACRKAQPK